MGKLRRMLVVCAVALAASVGVSWSVMTATASSAATVHVSAVDSATAGVISDTVLSALPEQFDPDVKSAEAWTSPGMDVYLSEPSPDLICLAFVEGRAVSSTCGSRAAVMTTGLYIVAGSNPTDLTAVVIAADGFTMAESGGLPATAIANNAAVLKISARPSGNTVRLVSGGTSQIVDLGNLIPPSQ